MKEILIVIMLIVCAPLGAMTLRTLRDAAIQSQVQQLADEGRERDAEIWRE